MPHRAEQILDAIAARLRAQTAIGIPADNIFVHRSLSLAEDQDEIPAATVNAGDEESADEYQLLDGDGELARALEIEVAVYFSATDEQTLKQLLFAARTEVHRAINPDETLGLAFVLKVELGAVPKPDIDVAGELSIGSQAHNWLVTYHMNSSDPT